jgi:hypothetical protein
VHRPWLSQEPESSSERVQNRSAGSFARTISSQKAFSLVYYEAVPCPYVGWLHRECDPDSRYICQRPSFPALLLMPVFGTNSPRSTRTLALLLLLAIIHPTACLDSPGPILLSLSLLLILRPLLPLASPANTQKGWWAPKTKRTRDPWLYKALEGNSDIYTKGSEERRKEDGEGLEEESAETSLSICTLVLAGLAPW